MKREVIMAACFVLWLSRCMAISRRELMEFVEYIERTSRLDQPPKTASDFDDEQTDEPENGDKFEGDMILDSRQRLQIIRDVASGGQARNGHRCLARRWPNAEVIYLIDDDRFTSKQVAEIKNAIKAITRVSCLKFRKYRSGDKNGIMIQGKKKDCFATVGRSKDSLQILNLNADHQPGKGCFRFGTILHEILHGLGFVHMHTNHNRDKYVRVNWENIKPGRRSSFVKYSSDDVTDFGVPYDYNSLMHYGARYSSANGKQTLTPLKRDAVITGQRKSMTASDIEKLNLMYCNDKSPKLGTLYRLNKLNNYGNNLKKRQENYGIQNYYNSSSNKVQQ